MVKVYPFKAFVPSKKLADRVVTLGSGKVPEAALREKAENNEFSYIRVVKPQYLQPEIEQGSPAFYQASLSNLANLLSNHCLEVFENGIYFYKQTHHSGKILSGWIVGIDADDYQNGKIKKHENTLKAKEGRLVEHIRQLKSMAEPVLLSQNLPEDILELSHQVQETSPLFSVSDEFGNQHTLWFISDAQIVERIQSDFSQIDSLYIADGHHRVAASSTFILEEFGHNSGKGFMALIMDDRDLLIKPFYRLIKYNQPLNLEAFFKVAGYEFYDAFDIHSFEDLKEHQVLVFSENEKWVIQLKSPESNLNAVEKLDVSVVERDIFSPVFGVENTANDNRVSFMRGDTSIEFIKEQMKEGKFQFAFLFKSNSMQEIKDVADQGLIMPPKSTFVEPKLLTGMVIEDYQH